MNTLHTTDVPAKPSISVIGCGYLGAVHAASMASLGFDVIGIEVDPVKAKTLAAGEAPFLEEGLGELLREGVDSGRLVFSTNIADAATADVHFICVGTPQKDGTGAANLDYVNDSVANLARALRKPALIVGKSTVPVGTAEGLRELVTENAHPSVRAELIWNPEFLRESKAVNDTLHPDRIVIGGASERAEEIIRTVYATPISEGIPFITMDLRSAELVKTTANSFLATKISFINAIAEMAENCGADVVKIAEAIGHDVRIGSKFLHAGVGFGGGCLPKDIRGFRTRAAEIGGRGVAAIMQDVDDVNARRRARVADLARAAVKADAYGTGKVAVLGATFKANTDDVRDSPALHVAKALHEAGLDVVVYDPAGNANAAAYAPRLSYADSMVEAVTGASVTLVLTEWDEFANADAAALAEVASAATVIDGRNVLPGEEWASAGWTVHRLGRPTLVPELLPVEAI